MSSTYQPSKPFKTLSMVSKRKRTCTVCPANAARLADALVKTELSARGPRMVVQLVPPLLLTCTVAWSKVVPPSVSRKYLKLTVPPAGATNDGDTMAPELRAPVL